jgi:hypothetical protein
MRKDESNRQNGANELVELGLIPSSTGRTTKVEQGRYIAKHGASLIQRV